MQVEIPQMKTRIRERPGFFFARIFVLSTFGGRLNVEGLKREVSGQRPGGRELDL
jgi:hypothetical protein